MRSTEGSRGRRPAINIQDGYLFHSLKEGQSVYLELLTGRTLLGRLRRFDRFALVLESEGKEILIYKHAIAAISEVASATLSQDNSRAVKLEDQDREISEITSYLADHLGPEVTAYLSGRDSSEVVQAWTQGRVTPDPKERARLEVAFKATQCLVAVCGDEMTRSWFFGMNEALRDTAPAYVLRHGSREDWAIVLSAAQQFAEI